MRVHCNLDCVRTAVEVCMCLVPYRNHTVHHVSVRSNPVRMPALQ